MKQSFTVLTAPPPFPLYIEGVSPSADKSALRTRMRTIRQDLATATPEASVRIAKRAPLSRLSRFRIVAAYVSQGSELDPEPLVQALLDDFPGQVQAALPVARDRTSALTFRLWTPGEPLERDAFNIPIPPRINAEVQPSLVITPLLAFDREGGRLGQGAGHYDRTLANLRKVRPVFVLGLAYAGQELERIPMEPHDQRLDAILTETDFIEVAKGSR
jgi:5-formyltetrahydrofolate cyclo-ligase